MQPIDPSHKKYRITGKDPVDVHRFDVDDIVFFTGIIHPTESAGYIKCYLLDYSDWWWILPRLLEPVIEELDYSIF